MKTLLFLNPYAKGGRLFSTIYKHKKELEEILGDVEFFGSTKEKDIFNLKNNLKNGKYNRIISVGGDGTNNYILNNYIIPLNLEIPFCNLPIGTGSDFCRTLEVPRNVKEAAKWILKAEVVNCDLGLIEYKTNGDNKKSYFLNIASFGLSGKVASLVNKWHKRGKTSFLRATIITLLTYKPSFMKISNKEKILFEGKNYLVAFANGQIFGGGMKIAPMAKLNDGFLDLILVKSASFFSFIRGLILVFKGKHLNHPSVITSKGDYFEIYFEKDINFEMDGEDKTTSFGKVKILNKKIKLLLNKEKAPLI